jgi:hypothetical protein
MSINLQDFDVLDPAQSQGSEVVLIDLRPDWIKDESHGLILHHPRLEKGELARVDGELLAKIDAAKPLVDPEFDSSKQFMVDIADPLKKDKDPDQRYWGAFEPVRYPMRVRASDPTDTERFGWVVLVQRPISKEAAAAIPAPAVK